jgi:hypothetical protein
MAPSFNNTNSNNNINSNDNIITGHLIHRLTARSIIKLVSVPPSHTHAHIYIHTRTHTFTITVVYFFRIYDCLHV